MSKFLGNLAKAFGGASMYYNAKSEKIDDAEAAADIKDKETLATASATKLDRIFQFNLAEHNSNLDLRKEAQLQLYATTNAAKKHEYEKALKIIDGKIRISEAKLQNTFTAGENVLTKTHEVELENIKRDNAITIQENSQLWNTAEKGLDRKHEMTKLISTHANNIDLSTMDGKQAAEQLLLNNGYTLAEQRAAFGYALETLSHEYSLKTSLEKVKSQLNDVGTTGAYYLPSQESGTSGVGDQSTIYHTSAGVDGWYGENNEVVATSRENRRPFLTYRTVYPNGTPIKIGSHAEAQNRINAWSRQLPKIKSLLLDAVGQSNIQDIKAIESNLIKDVWAYKISLTKGGDYIDGDQIRTRSPQKIPSIDYIRDIMNQLSEPSESGINEYLKYVVGYSWTTGQHSDVLEDERDTFMGKTLNWQKDHVTNNLNRDEDDNKPTNIDFFKAVRRDMAIDMAMFPEDYDQSGSGVYLWSKRIKNSDGAKVAEKLFNFKGQGNALLNAETAGVNMQGVDLTADFGIKPSKHFHSGYLSVTEREWAIGIFNQEYGDGAVYDSDNISKMIDAFQILMPPMDMNNQNVPVHSADDIKGLLERAGIEPKNLNAKYRSSLEALGSIDAILKIMEDYPRLPTGSVGRMLRTVMQQLDPSQSGNLLSIIKNQISGGRQDVADTFIIDTNGKFYRKLEGSFSNAANLVAKAGGVVENLSEKEMGNLKSHALEAYQALLAYQIAAAIQGGTGGRTISDQDVENIRRAMGNVFFDFTPGAVARLGAFRNVMQKISSVNQALLEGARNDDPTRWKATEAVVSLLYGGTLEDFSKAGWTGTAGSGGDSKLFNTIFTEDKNFRIFKAEAAAARLGDMDNVYSHRAFIIPDINITALKDGTYTFLNQEGKEVSKPFKKGDNLRGLLAPDARNDPKIFSKLFEEEYISETTFNYLDKLRKKAFKVINQEKDI